MAITLKPIKQERINFTIRSTASMIQHQWSEKAKKMIRDKKAGKKRGAQRDVCEPEQEFKDATYLTQDGEYGIPAMAFKASLISAAHKDIGIEKTLVRKSIFVLCDDAGGILPIECDDPVMREDYVRVGTGGADLRYRPEFKEWSCRISVLVDTDNLPVDAMINLVNRAGFGVGICEMRPEKGKDFGRFEVDQAESVEVQQ